MYRMVLWLLLFTFIMGACVPTSPTPPILSETPSPKAKPTSLPTVTPIAMLAPTSTPRPLISVTYYRLRIEYSSSSDWTTLDLNDQTDLLSARLMETSGTATNVGVSHQQLALNQPLNASQRGESVGMTVDFAISPEAISQPLPIILGKGDIGEIVLRVSVIVDGQPRFLQEITHVGAIPGSGGRNSLNLQVDLSELKDLTPIEAQIDHPTQEMIWAFYYPWYGPSDWSSPHLKDYPQTRYSSSDPENIANQIEQAQSAGIDGFISSWWGPGDYTDQNLEILLQLAQERGFGVSIYFETLTGEGGRDEAEILKWLTYAISEYGDHPAFFKVNGKPVIILWASNAVPLDVWQNVFSELRAQGMDALFLGMGYDTANLSVFDGIHEYGVFTIPNLAEVFQNTARATRYYSLLSDVPETKIFVASVQPGYDERLIPGRAGLFQDRENGQFYRSTFEAALQSEPDWIFITTWNEWWEHTHIEPSELHGDLYLQITNEFAERWKGR